jgi:hypothetical protein
MVCLDNQAGFGYCGATWPVVLKALILDGFRFPDGGWWTFCEKYPYRVNQALADYFALHYPSLSQVWRWHNNPDPNNNVDYQRKVVWINRYCGGDN